MSELVVENLSKTFPTRAEPLVVLRDVSLLLAGGQNAAILGPSGSGKSTLLFLVGTLDAPTGGCVKLGGVDPFSLDEKQLAEFRNRHIGFVFQDHYLLPQLTVLENVLIPAMAEGSPTAEAIERAKNLIGRVGLGERMEHRPAELSGGERQRAGVARALLLKPELVLADEPTGNLDSTTGRHIMDLLLNVRRSRASTLVLVTHDAELAALADTRLVLRDGRPVTPDDSLRKAGSASAEAVR